jgi:Vitamin B12 dependent methionine synthase, activation domain.
MVGLGIDRNEVLRYLGYKDQLLDESAESIIEECTGEVRRTAKPRYVYKFFNIIRGNEELSLEGSTICFKSADLVRHLEGAESCALMAVSLGSEMDAKIRYCEKTDMTRAVILDACATAAVEEICDKVCEEILSKVKLQGKTLTSRFSPGYGDLSLDIQRDFISVLRADKLIGLTASAENILIPRKSITAVVGIIDDGQRRQIRDCSSCSKFNECRYKRRKGGCGY